MTATIQASSISRRLWRRGVAFGVGAVLCLGAIGAGVAFAANRPEASIAPGTARLVPGDAAVTVHRGTPVATSDAPLRSGDRLTVVRGTAIVQTATGQLLARMGTTINFGDTSPRIVRGDVLAVGSRMRVATQPANLVVSGVTRIRQALTLEVASYEGRVSVRTVTDEYRLVGLRRVVVAGARGSASGRVSSVTMDAMDVWDRQYLGVAIELDRALNERSRGITLQSDGTDDAVKRQLMQVLAPWTDLVLVDDTTVGEAVVAAELATEAALDRSGLRELILWRADGVPWGLIAMQLGLTSLPAELPGVDETAIPAPGVPTTVGRATTATTATTLNGSSPPTGSGAMSPQPPQPPTTAPEPVVVNPLGGIVSGVGNVLGGLLGAE